MDEIELKLDKDWYLDDMEEDIEEEQISDTEKINALYHRYEAGVGEDRGVLDHDDLMRFVDLSRRIAESIGDVRDIESARAPEFFKRYLLRLRNAYAAEEDDVVVERIAAFEGATDATNTAAFEGAADATNTADTPIAVRIRSIMPYENELIIEGYFDIDRAGELEREYAQSAYSPYQDVDERTEKSSDEEEDLSWVDVSEKRTDEPATSKPRFLEPPLSAAMIMEFGVKGFNDPESLIALHGSGDKSETKSDRDSAIDQIAAESNADSGTDNAGVEKRAEKEEAESSAQEISGDGESGRSPTGGSGDTEAASANPAGHDDGDDMGAQSAKTGLEDSADSDVAENALRVSGGTTVMDRAEPSIIIHVGNRATPLPDAGHIAERRYFGKTLVTFRTFEVRIEMAALTEGTEIYFTCGAENDSSGGQASATADVTTGGQDIATTDTTTEEKDAATAAVVSANKELHCRMMFSEPQSGFQPQLGILYKKYRRGLALEYDGQSELFRVVKPTVGRRLSAEIDALYGLRGARISRRKKLAAFGLRFMYQLTRPYYSGLKLRAYYDKLYAGGDNGQVLFEYSSEVGERTGGTRRSHRYFASPQSRAYRELRTRGLCVQSTDSPWRKLVALQSHIVFATHADAWSFSGLDGFERRWFSDIMDARVVCIQHSLALRHVPAHQARYMNNAEMYCCAAYAEIDELGGVEYAYDPSMLKLTGIPRYDRLVSDAERVILLAPAWHRAENFEERPHGAAAGYDESFADSSVFAVYRDFLADDGLTEMLSRTGYRLCLLLHPEISAQISDFAPFSSDRIEIAASSIDGYERHLRRAALLVTDYGGVQYDWAYMEKPMVYFQPDELPPSPYDTVFDYDAVGFGPVARTADVLIAYLEGTILSGAGDPGSQHDDLVPATLYRDRMREFFAHDDRENCVRIFNEANQLG